MGARPCYHGCMVMLQRRCYHGRRDDAATMGQRPCYHGCTVMLPWMHGGATMGQLRCYHGWLLMLLPALAGASRSCSGCQGPSWVNDNASKGAVMLRSTLVADRRRWPVDAALAGAGRRSGSATKACPVRRGRSCLCASEVGKFCLFFGTGRTFFPVRAWRVGGPE
jgi:hypothetical protein